MGWLPIRLPAVCLALDRGASLPGLAVAWLSLEARALADLVLGMPAAVPSFLMKILECADGSDDRGGPAQGLAYCGGDRRRRGAAGHAADPRVRGPGGEPGGLGAGLAGADMGG